MRRAHSRFITSRSHTSQSTGESLSHACPVSQGLQEVLCRRDSGRGDLFLHNTSHTCFLSCSASVEWGTHLPPALPSTTHSLRLYLLCSAALSTQTIPVKYSELNGLAGSTLTSLTVQWGGGGLGERINFPGKSVLLREPAADGAAHMRAVHLVSSAVRLDSCQSWTGKRCKNHNVPSEKKALPAVLRASLYTTIQI